MTKANQNAHILVHLQRGWRITALDALKKYDCFRLSARIWDLRKRGHRINTSLVQVGSKRFAQYSLKRR